MKMLLFVTIIMLPGCLLAQKKINDEAMRYQSQRMVFQQWDKNKFKPGPGFLYTNPYYWMVWGLFHPGYKKKDLRPLSATGPQTQRLALVGVMNGTDNDYKKEADEIKSAALSEIANNSGLISAADPLWFLYYKGELSPVLNYTPSAILSGLSPQVRDHLVSGGVYNWYLAELERLKQRVEGAHNADMDRGSRILAYHRLLKDYRVLAGAWNTRTAAAQQTIDLTAQQQKLKNAQVPVIRWTPHSDIDIANQVLKHVK
ncbi:MAG: hypothetical protein EOP49_30780 [Sphingobacteriales bacterium]|nr:MAG: hypothetical protein EOP49_30780 [Sphingobacteriales bacterium]